MKGLELYVNEIATGIGLDNGSPNAMRLGYKLLQAAVGRIEDGLSIQDFLDGPQQQLREVHKVYRAFAYENISKKDALRQLTALNEEYVQRCAVKYDVSEAFIRATVV
ncbi:MAG TPA: hypothetical protein VI934_00675 [Candidatus Nanoarchaeia archaeon]|nr:hypothetical protein [Candidatus Nanoarchaeia archaeon]